MTVRHVGTIPARRIWEPKQDFGNAPLRDRGDILPPRTLGSRRLAVLGDDAELAAMDVHRMQHQVGAFRDPPTKILVAGRRKIDSVERERLSVHTIRRELLGFRQRWIADD